MGQVFIPGRFAFPVTRYVREVFVGLAPRFKAKYGAAILVFCSEEVRKIESVALDIATERCRYRGVCFNAGLCGIASGVLPRTWIYRNACRHLQSGNLVGADAVKNVKIRIVLQLGNA
jgi:hypothetical protein